MFHSTFRRCYSFFKPSSPEALRALYDEMRYICNSKRLPDNVKENAVFACNELDLKEVMVYGFDYDYTLACYKPSLDYLIYNLARLKLHRFYQYPKDIMELKYMPDFAIRGLHYDIEHGILMKLDSFLQVQFGSAYRGLTPLLDSEVLNFYQNHVIPIGRVEGHLRYPRKLENNKMIQLADLFSVPEIVLLCNLTDYFSNRNVDYDPAILFRDVKESIRSSHQNMHYILMNNVEKFIEPNNELRILFENLVKNNKKLFLITNSPYNFVNVGMEFLVGKDWCDFFELIIVKAKKPHFFTDDSTPLRVYDNVLKTHSWDKILVLRKGVVYLEGNIKQLLKMTGWKGHQIMYFGDHPYTDLADVTLEYGWKTGAIIKELTHEIRTLNDDQFKKHVNWLQIITQLVEHHQENTGDEQMRIIKSWIEERDFLRQEIKCVFNKQFGSVFRTYHNPTYFSRRLFRFADIYTSNISNLLNYSVNHSFFPRRGVMPHEYTALFM